MTTEQILINIIEEGIENDVYSLGWNGDVKEFEFMRYRIFPLNGIFIDKSVSYWHTYVVTVGYSDNFRLYEKIIHISKKNFDGFVSKVRDNKIDEILK